MKKTVSALFAVLCLLMVSASLASAADIDLAKAKATFEATCGLCHGIDRPLGVAGRDQAGWTATVKRMSGHHVDKMGKAIPDEDQAAIVEYLVKNAGK